MRGRSLAYWALVAAVAAVYFGAAKLGLTMALVAEQVTAVWPPTGIALAALVLFGNRLWPGIALGAFLANLTAHEPLASACGIALGNTLEAVLGAYLLRRFVEFRPSLARIKDVFGLIGLAAGLSPIVSATIGVTSLCLGGVQPWDRYGSIWWVWWQGDAMGDLVTAPVLLTCLTKARIGVQTAGRAAEAAALFATLIIVTQIVFAGRLAEGISDYPLEYTVFPFAVWAALRFGPPGTTLVSFVASGIAIWGTIHGFGPFARWTINERLTLLQCFMGVVAVTGLVLAAVTSERKHIEKSLRENDERLKASNAFTNAILAAALDCVITMDHRGRIVEFNPAAEKTFGYSRAEVLGKALAELIVPPSSHDNHRQGLENYLAAGERTFLGKRVEMAAVRADGTEFPVEAAITRINAPGPPMFTGFVRDISDLTDRKRAGQRLAAQYALTSILAQPTTLAEASPKILQATCESLGLDMGAIWKVDAEAKLLRFVELWHKPAVKIPEFAAITRRMTFPPGLGLPGRIWATGEPAWIVNAVEDSNFPRAPVAAKEGLHAAFGFPIKLDDQVLGVIEFFSRQILPPDEDLLRMMATIGAQVGQFIVRKRTEEALAEEHNLLRTLIDSLPDAIYIKDTQSRFILGNKGVARIMGAPGGESLVGKTDFDFYPAELAERYCADERAVLDSGQPLINREEPVVDPSGRRGWLLTTKAPLRDTRGRVVGLVGMGRDITDRKREEEQHRLSEARLQAILDNTTAVIYLKDTQGRYLLINRQFEDLLHVTREQVVNKTAYDLFPAEMADTFQLNDRTVLETRTPLEFEEAAPHDGQIRTYISIKFPLCDSAGAPYAVCGISTDITERKRTETKLIGANVELLETNTELGRSEVALRKALADLQASHEQLKATQLQLIQAEKMESVGTLAAGVGHEMKNPLQTILMGLAYVSKNIPAGDENLALALTDMHDAVKRADAIVRDLLYLSASKQLEIKEEDFNAVVEHSLWLVNYELTRSRVSLLRELAADLPRVGLDKAKMEQVFINLFMNAIQAMPQGGTLTVRTSARRLTGTAQPDERTVGHLNAGDTVVVAEIQDSGIGIPDEKLPRIFEPFFTTKPTGVGTGLGLPVTKQIIDMHGGTISIGPGTNGGVRVTLMLSAEKGG